jgi:type I restriction enzyme R subunit
LVIFRRYHQRDTLLKLEADARAHGAAVSYLVEHSAGSGKSNTIAWTAHGFSNLHDANDTKAIVITDRVIVDQQHQETTYQFETPEA